MTTPYPTPNEDRVLRLFTRLHFLKNEHIRRRFYAPSSISFVRKMTASLASHGYLDVENQPKVSPGSTPLYFRLTTKALRYLAETGADVHIPTRGSDPPPSFFFLEHTFSVNDFLIALELFEELHTGVQILELRHERDLKRTPDHVKTVDGDVSVVPDAWTRIYIGEDEHCISLELDRGTEEQKRWRRKVRGLMAWMDGPYQQTYQTEKLVIAVLAIPGVRRRDDLIRWTEHELTAQEAQAYGEFFCFCDRDPATTDPDTLFADPIWIEPFTHTTRPLLSGVNRSQA